MDMDFDIIIVGGNLSGLMISLVLGGLGYKVAVFDKKPESDMDHIIELDNRSYSLTPKSVSYLSKIGIWQDVSEFANPIKQIRISDNNSKLFLHFDNKLLDNKILGYMLENRYIVRALFNKAKQNQNITLLYNTEFTRVQNEETYVTIQTNSGVIKAKLLIGADGKFSMVKQFTDIATISWDYHQKALVGILSHENNHDCIAHEIFRKQGPFATLPLVGGFRSAVVWTERPNVADFISKQSKRDINYILQNLAPHYLGKIEFESEILTYPLKAFYTEHYYQKRILLLGDATHAMHPLAGQGFNMTIKDIEFLHELLKKEHLSLDNYTTMQGIFSCYQQERLGDNLAMIAITDSLDKIFSSQFIALSLSRKAGLYALNRFDIVKKTFMKYAMGNR